MSESETIPLRPTQNEYEIKHCITCHKPLKRLPEISLKEKERIRKFMIEYWDVEIVCPEDVICKYEPCCGNWPNVLFIRGGRGIIK